MFIPPASPGLDIEAEIPLAAYIFRRLQSIGIGHIFGCPGDFNLNLLDHLYTVPGVQWVGTCNELNAAYAADGYARVRGIPGALVTTYGVGELSAINGISGAYAEHLPVIHIVGTTSRRAIRNRTMIHHTLGEEWDHLTFSRMSEPVRSGAVWLDCDETFAEDVDRIIELCVKMRKPVYIFIPMDVPDLIISSKRLKTPLDLQIKNPESESALEDEIVEQIQTLLKAASKPAILVDVLAHRYGLAAEVDEFLSLTNLKGFTTPLSKSIIDETGPKFAGMYNGKLTPLGSVKSLVEDADFLLHIGPIPSDSNTGGWSQTFNEDRIILHPEYVTIGGKKHVGINFVPIFKKLVAALNKEPKCLSNGTTTNGVPNGTNGLSTTNGTNNASKSLAGPLEQHNFWKQFTPFLKPNDIIIAEVGSAQYGTLDLVLPLGSVFFTQLYYSCIGFTVGALLGALVARREQGTDGRVILFIGDGSLHMTVQEISTIIRQGFKPTIVLINNAGYTIERVIHGPVQHYNDISETWDYQAMLHFFGAPKSSKSYAARTYEELAEVLVDGEFNNNREIQLLEVFMDKFDSPWALTEQVNIMQGKSVPELLEWDRETGRRRKVLDQKMFDTKFALMESLSNRHIAGRRDVLEVPS